MLRQAELFEEMEEKDAHLGAVLQTRKLAVAGLEWEVESVSQSDADLSVAGFVREAIEGVENFDEALIDLLDAIGKGFSVLEVMWEIDSGRALVRRLEWCHQKMFTFYDGTGVGDSPRLLTDAAPAFGEPLPAGRFMVHRTRGRSGIAARGGILRPCAWMYLFKNYTVKDWVAFNERYAQPMRVGKFSPGASEHERKVLRDAVFNLSNDAAAVISDSTVIELLESAGRSGSIDSYERLASFCDSSISKAVLGQTLTTESGGSYAAARVHQMVRQDLLEADARALGRTITGQLIRPLVEFNFGPGTPIPRFVLQHESREDLLQLAQTLREVAALGLRIPPRYLAGKFGIPEAIDNEGGNDIV